MGNVGIKTTMDLELSQMLVEVGLWNFGSGQDQKLTELTGSPWGIRLDTQTFASIYKEVPWTETRKQTGSCPADP